MTASDHQLLCVVAPCYNEQEIIERFYHDLKSTLLRLDDLDHRILFVDDGSTDGTLERLNAIADRDHRVDIFSLSRNFGHQVALTAALDHAAGDAVIMMDSDLQHPPSLIAVMVQRWREGYDIVSTVRTWTDEAPLSKRLLAKGFYWLINRLSDTPVVEGAADFCLLSGRAHRALCNMPERHRFLRGMVSWIGFRRVLVPFQAPARAGGLSKYTLWKMIGLALDAVFSFSAAPMRWATRLGGAIVALGAVYFVYILGRHFLLGDLVPGWGSLICTLLIVGGMQLVFIGFIGAYLARVFEESKRRPLYFFKQRPDNRVDHPNSHVSHEQSPD